jgi:hypothetical protein
MLPECGAAEALEEAWQSGWRQLQVGRVLLQNAQETNPNVPVHWLVARKGTGQEQTFETKAPVKTMHTGTPYVKLRTGAPQ